MERQSARGGSTSTYRYFEVSRKDLPACCPRPGESLWSLHPRVFLSLDETGRAKCPYCGAEFLLKG